MNQNEVLAKQILQAYVNGTVDLSNVPELQRIAEEAAERQMDRMLNATDTQAKQKVVKKETAEQEHKLNEQILVLTHMQAKIEQQQKFWIPVLVTVLPTLAFLLISFCALWFIFIR